MPLLAPVRTEEVRDGVLTALRFWGLGFWGGYLPHRYHTIIFPIDVIAAAGLRLVGATSRQCEEARLS